MRLWGVGRVFGELVFVCEVILRVVNDIYVQYIDLKRGENALELSRESVF